MNVKMIWILVGFAAVAFIVWNLYQASSAAAAAGAMPLASGSNGGTPSGDYLPSAAQYYSSQIANAEGGSIIS